MIKLRIEYKTGNTRELPLSFASYNSAIMYIAKHYVIKNGELKTYNKVITNNGSVIYLEEVS